MFDGYNTTHAEPLSDLRGGNSLDSDTLRPANAARPSASNGCNGGWYDRPRADLALRNLSASERAQTKGPRRSSSGGGGGEPNGGTADEASAALVWRLRARVVYLRATALGDREVEIPRAWLRAAIEVPDELDVETIAKRLSSASGSKLRIRPGKDGGIVVLVEAAAPVADVRRVFETWREVVGKTKALLDRKRERKIRDRLREGYEVERLEAAIRGAMLDPFLRGENDRGQAYLDLATILRDGPQVERLEALATAGERRAGSVFRRART